eukprot:TRINITY_DN2590_c0_g1_i1.p1 TRINITY_DN2590_c0_g1~~TRINITY_DN2590_c0_g1_i1.p1  ORF type:complete len:185 (+),score=26.65 TRINITY_DN2590_c0_g1_i1:335-889(+)
MDVRDFRKHHRWQQQCHSVNSQQDRHIMKEFRFSLKKAVRTATYGRPGAVYLDFPAELLLDSIPKDSPGLSFPPRCKSPPISQAAPTEIDRAAEVLKGAKRPLVIVGQGCNYANASEEVREFINRTHLPFLPTPKGKERSLMMILTPLHQLDPLLFEKQMLLCCWVEDLTGCCTLDGHQDSRAM